MQGQDSDGDGHLSAACAANPGDDCDDAELTVYAGAPELCDQLDNDCNGEVDVDDGLVVSGTDMEVGPSDAAVPALAWATDQNVYGVAYVAEQSNALDIYFKEVDPVGAVKLQPIRLDATATFGATLAPIALSWGGDSFAVAWVGAKNAYLQVIGSDGSRLLPSVPIPFAATTSASYLIKLARIPGGNWGVVLSGGGGIVQANTVTPSGAVSAPLTFVPSTTVPSSVIDNVDVAAVGQDFVMADANSDGISVNMYSAEFVPDKTLSVSGLYPAIGSGPNGFAIAVGASARQNLEFYAYDATGTPVCGPVKLPDGQFVASAVVAAPRGYLVASSGAASGRAGLGLTIQEVLSDCTLGEHFALGAMGVELSSLASGTAGFAAAWETFDPTGAAGASKVRFFGTEFCN